MTLAEMETVLAWAGTIIQAGGALLLASRWADPPFCYLIMLIGAVTLFLVAVGRADFPQMFLMLSFIVINLIGTTRWARWRRRS